MAVKIKSENIETRAWTKYIEYTDEAGVYEIKFIFEKPMPIESARKIIPVVMGRPPSRKKITNKGKIIKV